MNKGIIEISEDCENNDHEFCDDLINCNCKCHPDYFGQEPL